MSQSLPLCYAEHLIYVRVWAELKKSNLADVVAVPCCRSAILLPIGIFFLADWYPLGIFVS